MVLHLKLEQSTACRGERRKLLLFLLYAVITQYDPTFASLRFTADVIHIERCWIPKREEKDEWYVRNSIPNVYCHFLFFFPFVTYSGYDKGETTSCEFFFSRVFILSSILIRTFQCIVGDSSTVCHGSSYLKKWLAWLEANADVKYAGLE